MIMYDCLGKSLDSEKLKIINLFLTDRRVLDFIKQNLFKRISKIARSRVKNLSSNTPLIKSKSRDTVSSQNSRSVKQRKRPGSQRIFGKKYDQKIGVSQKSPYKQTTKLITWSQKIKRQTKGKRRTKSSAQKESHAKPKFSKIQAKPIAPIDFVKKLQQEQPWIFKTYD